MRTSTGFTVRIKGRPAITPSPARPSRRRAAEATFRALAETADDAIISAENPIQPSLPPERPSSAERRRIAPRLKSVCSEWNRRASLWSGALGADYVSRGGALEGGSC